MFITDPDSELTMLNALLGQDGSKQWSYVELCLSVPWFCATVCHEEDGFHLKRTFHLSNPEQLAGLVEQAGETLEGVDVALPSHMTGRSGWSMQPLRAIWVGTAHDDAFQYLYVTRSGKRFARFNGPRHERELKDAKQLVGIPAKRMETSQRTTQTSKLSARKVHSANNKRSFGPIS